MRVGVALLFGLIACGSSPAYQPNAPPTGTLIVVIRQGPDRVPFRPKIDRIRRANEQLAAILGHSIEIELDGALMPQDHDGAEDVIARLLETVDRDLDELKKYEPRALERAKSNFNRLVVRYSPAEAQQRGNDSATLNEANNTVDVVVPEATWFPLDRGEIGHVFVADAAALDKKRYDGVLPDTLPAKERRGWFEFWKSHNSKQDAPTVIGAVDAIRVRGMLMLTADPDPKLAADARKEVIDRELSNFRDVYHQHAEAIESAPANGPFHTAEKALVDWMNREVPKMSLDERAKVADAIWVIDFRKDQGDRFATYSFPGFDPMAFSLATIDLWIQQGHPSEPKVFQDIVTPAKSTIANGELKFDGGCCDQWFYKWATVSPQRRQVFAAAVFERKDPQFMLAAFYNAHFVMREESDYIAFMRRFESSPQHWVIGEQIHRTVVYRPSQPLLEEAKRWWRQVPIARGFALFYFARHNENSYREVDGWDDLLQDQKVDDKALASFLDLGWSSFQLLPSMWKGIGKFPNRVNVVLDHTRPMLDQNIRAEPGSHNVAGTLADVARAVCTEGALGELAQIHAFAIAELPKRPGQGLSDVVDESDPAKCHPKPSRTPPHKKKPSL